MPEETTTDLFRTVAVALGVTLLATVVFFGIPFLGGLELFLSHDAFGSDFWHFNYPLKDYLGQALSEGRLPLWVPELGMGFPLLAEMQVGALYPPNLLLFGLLPTPLAFNLMLVLHLALATVSTALYARVLGASRAGAALAGSAFAFSAFFITHLRHANVVATASWVPLLFFLLERYVRTSRRLLPLIALSAGMMILAGHPQIAFYGLALGAAYAVALAWEKPQRQDRLAPLRMLLPVAAAFLAGVALAGAQLLPTYELTGTGPRDKGMSYEEASAFTYHPAYLLTFLDPAHFGHPGVLKEGATVDPETGVTRPTLRGFMPVRGFQVYWEVVFYAGLIPLALAIPGLFHLRRTSRRRWVVTLLLCCLCLLLGILTTTPGSSLGKALFEHLPGFRFFRFHSRLLAFSTLWLCVWAGLGLTWVQQRVRARGWKRSAVAVGAGAVLLTLLDLFLALGDYNPRIPAGTWIQPPGIVPLLAAANDPLQPPPRVLSLDASYLFVNAYFVARGWKGDLSPYHPVRAALAPNLNLLYRVPSAGLYFGLQPRHLLQFETAISHFSPKGLILNPSLTSLANVRFILTPDPLKNQGYRLSSILAMGPLSSSWPPEQIAGGLTDMARLFIYENPSVLPRAFLASTARVVPDPGGSDEKGTSLDKALTEELSAPGFDAGRQVLIALEKGEVPPPDLPPGDGTMAPVRFAEATPHFLRLEVDAPRDCWLFLADTYYPGWQAEVDGIPSPIYRANLFGRAVFLKGGTRRVEFRYSPGSLRWGFLLSALGILALAGLWLLQPFRAPRGNGSAPPAPSPKSP